MEPGGPWESVISAVSAWMESVLLTSYFPKKGIQDICQELKIPIGTYLKKNSWQPSLKDKYFLSCVRAQLPGFCLYKPLTLSLPWDTLFGFTQICVSWIAILFCLSLFFFFFFKSLLNLLQYCFRGFCFFGQEHMGSSLPNQGSNLHHLFWKVKS